MIDQGTDLNTCGHLFSLYASTPSFAAIVLLDEYVLTYILIALLVVDLVQMTTKLYNARFSHPDEDLVQRPLEVHTSSVT